MSYQDLKYKKKYLELKDGAGLDKLPEELINEIFSSQKNCKKLIKAVPINRQAIKAVN